MPNLHRNKASAYLVRVSPFYAKTGIVIGVWNTETIKISNL
jgi:hypothetical protein